MRDSRLPKLLDTIGFAGADSQLVVESCTEMLNEGMEVHDSIALARAQKLCRAAAAMLKDAHKAIEDITEPAQCQAHSRIGTPCGMENGHPGQHIYRSGSREWDEDADRAMGAQIAASMEGRRD